MEYIKVLVTIAVGALIGYCTNYIAIKMLFRPRKPVYIMGRKLPFTPGIIPKNQNRIAKAVGSAVGNTLLTNEDILQVVGNGPIKNGFVANVGDLLYQQDDSLKDTMRQWNICENPDEFVEHVSDVATEKVINAIKNVDLVELFGKLGNDAFADLKRNPMLAMFLNDNMIHNIATKLGEVADSFLDENGRELIGPWVMTEVNRIFDNSLGNNLAEWEISRERIDSMLANAYDSFLSQKGNRLLEKLNIAGIVENKINGMDVSALEELVMSVMKRELQAVINLGALIGAVIGLLNLVV